jgi:hypothetical protein
MEVVLNPHITTVIELVGINMAATTGDNSPRTAKYNPMAL